MGRVFGLFLPKRIEFIEPEGEEAEERSWCKTVKAEVLKTESRRGCGKRVEGGYYAVTDPEAESEDGGLAAETLEELMKKMERKRDAAGAESTTEDSGVEVRGDFLSFLSPVPIPGTKRFRGIKRWSLDPDAEDEAEMILEAV